MCQPIVFQNLQYLSCNSFNILKLFPKKFILKIRQSTCPWATNYGEKQEEEDIDTKSIRFAKRREIEAKSEGIFGFQNKSRVSRSPNLYRRNREKYNQKVEF